MICHVVMWKLKDGRDEIVQTMKKELEQLPGQIPGLLSLELGIDHKDSHNVVLISKHESWDALELYAKHPLHVAAADTYVRPYIDQRQSVNYETK